MMVYETAEAASTFSGRVALLEAVMRAVVYADIFDFALTPAEIHRSLEIVASDDETDAAISDACRQGVLRETQGLITLAGRSTTASSRSEWAGECAHLWRLARRYGQVIWALPFVRFVGVSGGLAADCTREGSDIDYFVVTSPGRLWLVRGAIVLVCKLARWLGHELCPNYLVTLDTLDLPSQDLYTARELVQMVPLHGMSAYERLVAANRWYEVILPNAQLAMDATSLALSSHAGIVKWIGERMLAGRLGDLLESWERGRTLGRLRDRMPRHGSEVYYDNDVCKGHDLGHAQSILDAYHVRLRRHGLERAQRPVRGGSGVGNIIPLREARGRLNSRG